MLVEVRCPACRKLLFRASRDKSAGEVEVKCACRRIVSYSFRTGQATVTRDLAGSPATRR